MSEEEKEEVKKEAQQTEAPEAAAEEAPKQPKVLKHARIKVTRMSLDQVNDAIEELQKHMGGMHSRYAQSLLAQKSKLMSGAQSIQQKAA